jgi:dTDP-4-amino-4,6-dideoxygalactose transaminase
MPSNRIPTDDSERIPLSVPDLRGNESRYLEQCIRDNWVSSAGPFVADMERRVGMLVGRSDAVATVNGTAALHLALTVAGIGRDDRVMVPDWTFVATANAVCHAGAVPFFTDVNAETWSLDPGLVVRALGRLENRIRAVIVVHPLGHPADIDPIRAACERFGIPLIEDAAGAIGALYKGRPVGSFGRLSIFSFNGNKTVTAGGGGMVVTDEPGLAERIRSLSTQARIGADYLYREIGYNYRMTNLNAAVGLAQLERLNDMVAAKRAVASVYDSALAGREDMRPMPRMPWAESSCWLYSVRCASVSDAETLVNHLRKQNIEGRIFWRALSPQPAFSDCPRLLTGVARELSGRVVSLPCGSALTQAQQERVVTALSEWQGSPVKELPADTHQLAAQDRHADNG